MTHAALFVALSLSLQARPVVLLAPEDRSLILGPIVQSVQAQLSDLPVELRVQPVAKLEGLLGAQMRLAKQVAGDEGLAVVWLELSPGDPVFVYVADPQRSRVLARSVDWDGALGHLEAVGLIVRSSVQALLAGQSIGFEAPAQRVATGGQKPLPPPPPPRQFHLGAAVGYTPGILSDGTAVMHGLDVQVWGGYREHLFASLQYRVYFPFLQRAGTYAIAEVARHPASVAVGGRQTWGRFSLSAELAATFDLVTVEMKDVGPWFKLSPPSTQLIFSLGPSLTTTLRLADPVSLYLGAGVDVPVGERRYLTEGPAGTGVVLTPWEVQPRAFAGVRFDVL